MNMLKYKPTASLLNRDIDNFFNNFFTGNNRSPFGRNYPAVDVREEKEQYVLEADLPGLTEKDIEVKVEDNLLTISSAKTENKEEKKEGYLYKERRNYSFHRSFVLPEDVDKAQIAASFTKGVLTLTMAKSPEAQPRQIEIKGQ